MPEEPEVDTEKLHEAVHEELEREGSGFLRQIALTTAVLASVDARHTGSASGLNSALARLGGLVTSHLADSTLGPR